MVKILNYGSLNIDKVYKVDHIVKPGETITSSNFSIHAGGKGENQSAALGKAGMNVYHAGKIGTDGLFLLDLLKKCSVNTDFVSTDAQFTGQAIIQVADSGQNSIFLLSGGNRENSTKEIDAVLQNFKAGDYLILQNEINNVNYLIEQGKQKNMIICFNPSPFAPEIREYNLKAVDMFFVNEIEACQILEISMDDSIKNDYPKILKKLCNIYCNAQIILTVGKKGSYYSDGKEVLHQPIIDTKVIDTTAAGDTFMGYFIASSILGFTKAKSLYYATLASSITVSKIGALESIPFGKEIF
jgi:ribokinase